MRPHSRATAYSPWATAKALLLTFRCSGWRSALAAHVATCVPPIKPPPSPTHLNKRAQVLEDSRARSPQSIPLAHARLHLGRTEQRIYHAAEINEEAVTGRLD